MTAIYDYKIGVFIPEELVFPLRDELARIGVGVIGNYDHCIAFSLVRVTNAVSYARNICRLAK